MGTKIFIFTFVLLIAVSITGTIYNVVQRRRLQSAILRLEQKVARESLIGKSPERVTAFLNREGFPCRDYELKSESGPENNDHTIRCKIADGAQTISLIEGPYVYDVMLRFRFDHQDRLIEYTVGASAVGL
jgi:hypothetical protein